MGGLEITKVDERDSGWERHNPRFRVYVQKTSGSYIGGWTETYDIVGADIVQVIDWAQRRAGDTLVYSVALVYDDEAQSGLTGHGRGLVWLVGMDGNRAELDPAEAEIQRRMLARRREPIITSPGDEMPHGVAGPDSDGNEPR